MYYLEGYVHIVHDLITYYSTFAITVSFMHNKRFQELFIAKSVADMLKIYELVS